MMHLRTIILWLVPSICLAYHPPAAQILSQMGSKLRQSKPIVLRVVRERPADVLTREYRVQIPADSLEDAAVDQDFIFPFSYFTLPDDELLAGLGSLSDEGVSVRLARFQGSVCYLLEGRSERLWLRKSDSIPLKIESLSKFGEWTSYIYLDLVAVSEKVVYPSRTEVQRNGSLISVERLVPAGADTGPP